MCVRVGGHSVLLRGFRPSRKIYTLARGQRCSVRAQPWAAPHLAWVRRSWPAAAASAPARPRPCRWACIRLRLRRLWSPRGWLRQGAAAVATAAPCCPTRPAAARRRRRRPSCRAGRGPQRAATARPQAAAARAARRPRGGQLAARRSCLRERAAAAALSPLDGLQHLAGPTPSHRLSLTHGWARGPRPTFRPGTHAPRVPSPGLPPRPGRSLPSRSKPPPPPPPPPRPAARAPPTCSSAPHNSQRGLRAQQLAGRAIHTVLLRAVRAVGQRGCMPACGAPRAAPDRLRQCPACPAGRPWSWILRGRDHRHTQRV
jgi:hypothetical protein